MVGLDVLLPSPKENCPRTALPGTISMSDAPEPFRFGIGGASPSFGGANLDAIRGVKEWDLTWVWVAGSGPRLGFGGTEPEDESSSPFGGDEEGLEPLIMGNSTFRYGLLTGVEELEVDVVVLVTLSLRLVLYCWIFSWILVSRGDKDRASALEFLSDTFPRSSADLDQALREILRRSPRPLLGVMDLAGEVGVDGTEGSRSMVVLVRPTEGRSRTDLFLG